MSTQFPNQHKNRMVLWLKLSSRSALCEQVLWLCLSHTAWVHHGFHVAWRWRQWNMIPVTKHRPHTACIRCQRVLTRPSLIFLPPRAHLLTKLWTCIIRSTLDDWMMDTPSSDCPLDMKNICIIWNISAPWPSVVRSAHGKDKKYS